MKIRCENCHTEFYYEPPMSGEPPSHVPCTECAFPNPWNSSGHGGTSSVVQTQCFNCGRKMVHDANLAIPICRNCQEGEEQASSAREWMIKKVNGQIYGPFDAETIQAWIEANKIDSRDEVAKVGGQWKRFDEHAVFRRFFPETRPASTAGSAPLHTVTLTQTTPASSPAASAQSASRRSPPIDWGEWARNAVGVVGIVVAIGGSVFLSRAQWLVLPEPWVETIRLTLRERVYDPLLAEKTPADPTLEEFQALLETLRARYPAVTEASPTLFVRGRTQFRLDTARGRAQAVSLLEQAVVADPSNELALAALAEVYADGSDPQLQRTAGRLIDRANQLNRGSAEITRARAAFLTATSNFAPAREAAFQVLELNPSDGEAAYYVGLSFLRQPKPALEEALRHLSRATELDPRMHRAYYQLGEVFIEQLEYRKAHESLQKKLDMEPQNARALSLLARLLDETGETDGALAALEKAHGFARGEDPAVSLQYAILLYQTGAGVRPALGILQDLLKAEGELALSLPDRKSALVHLAAVQRLDGNAAAAAETAAAALAIDASYGPALFQQGLASLAMGKLDAAGKALRSITFGEGEGDVQSDVRFYLGRILLEQAKLRDVVDELGDALDDFKNNLKPRMLLVHALVRSEQREEALATAREGALQDPFYMSRRGLRTLYSHRMPSLGDIGDSYTELARERFYMADAVANLGSFQLQAGLRGAAMQTFQRALQVDEGNASALLNLAFMASEQGDVRNALSILDKLIAHNSQLGLAYVLQGRAFTQLGRLEDADTAFLKAMRYERTNPLLHDSLGLYHVKRGKLDLARAAFRQAIALDPRYIPARAHLFRHIP